MLNKFLIGGTGLGVVEYASQLPVKDTVTIIVELIIGIATLIGIFKKNKK